MAGKIETLKKRVEDLTNLEGDDLYMLQGPRPGIDP